MGADKVISKCILQNETQPCPLALRFYISNHLPDVMRACAADQEFSEASMQSGAAPMLPSALMDHVQLEKLCLLSFVAAAQQVPVQHLLLWLDVQHTQMACRPLAKTRAATASD